MENVDLGHFLPQLQNLFTDVHQTGIEYLHSYTLLKYLRGYSKVTVELQKSSAVTSV